MKAPWAVAVSLSVFLLCGAAGAAHLLISGRINTPEFREMAAAQASELLRTRVSIGKVQSAFLNQISFSDLDLERDADSRPYLVHVEKVDFKFHFWQFLTLNFKFPQKIVLHGPHVVVSDNQFPYSFLESKGLETPGAIFADVRIKGGEFRYDHPGLKLPLILTGVDGLVSPDGFGKVRLSVTAQADGIIRGNVRINGQVDFIRRTHDLNLELKSVELDDSIALPFGGLNGTFRWTGDQVSWSGVRADIRGWQVKLDGSFKHYTLKPVLDASFRFDRKAYWGRFNLSADLSSETFLMTFQPSVGRDFSISGRMKKNDEQLSFDSIESTFGYGGEGLLNFKTGDYRWKFFKKNQEIEIVSNMRGMNFSVAAKLDHVRLNRLDLVTSFRVQIVPLSGKSGEDEMRFRGSFETDYFILEYAPFEDFRGSFDLTTAGVQNWVSSWGKSFKMDGHADWSKGDLSGRLQLRVAGFDLSEVQEFASKPLPKRLGGLLDGKLTAEGSFKRPEVIGRFTIKEGALGRLDYDRGIIQFRGFPPYLPLTDSKIYKGRSTLILAGALDLKLKNMFHGVQIQNQDKLVIWKGWEVHSSESEGLLEVGNDKTFFPPITVERREGRQQNLTGGTEDPQEEKVVSAGPRFKF